MLINNVKAYDYRKSGGELALVLGCSVDEALAMDSALLNVTTDDGDFVEAFAGYAKRSATVDATTGRVTLLCYLDSDGSGAAVAALAQELSAAKAENADLQAQIAEQAAAIRELAELVGGE